MEHHNKLKILSLGLVLFVVFFSLQGCYYDNEEELYPATTECITADMSFAKDVWPVINASCTGCHSGANPSGGIKLENYADVSGASQINPGNYGSLYGVISHASGNSPMPKNSDKLPDCTISQIKAWIDQGAQDN